MAGRGWYFAVAGLLGALIGGCGGSDETGSGGATSSSTGTTTTTTTTSGTGGSLPTGLESETADTTFLTADHMLAGCEMQISGEPFAEILGRDLATYDRFSADSNISTDPDTGMKSIDLLGWALAIESYEYSKQPMNNTSFESGAGLSLAYGPALNPENVGGESAFQLLFDRVQYMGLASRASGATVGKDFVTIAPSDPNNTLGWPGFWPVFAEFRSFDPTIAPAVGTEAQCNLAGATDEPVPPDLLPPNVGDYECDYNTLNLPDRDAASDKVIEPDALGYAAWKQGLWAINYWATMHDVAQNPIETVSEGKLAEVGIPGNTVIGQFTSPVDPSEMIFGKDGTFLGGVSLEGFQGLMMLDELYNKTLFLLNDLTTTDGNTLGGFQDIKAALEYDYDSPLQWFPGSVSVSETAQAQSPADEKRLFPKPTSFSISAGESRLRDYAGLLTGFGTYYATTDEGNPEIGGSQQFRATYDGIPFPGDNQSPDGEDSPHDAVLGLLKVAIINLDRMHYDAANEVLVDSSTADAMGTTVDTFDAGYSIVGMRVAMRALNSSLSLYGNDTPDQFGAPNPLDQTSLNGAPFNGSIESRLVTLVKAQGDFISTKLMGADGLVVNGYDLATSTADASPTTLAAQAAAVRGLLEAYLVTSDDKYRQAASLAYDALEARFWMDDIKAYRTTVDESSTMEWTPRTFAALTAAQRQYWKLVANAPGQEDKSQMVLDHITRTFKLVANGWNDLNGDEKVDLETECMGGRLQMAERALTGEMSEASDDGDRDKDCVPDIATAHLPSALAAKVVISRK